jgi:hypothetical protein
MCTISSALVEVGKVTASSRAAIVPLVKRCRQVTSGGG